MPKRAESPPRWTRRDAEPAVTVSIGVATFPLDAVEGDAPVRAADEALHASKRNGRNRVTSIGDSSPSPLATT